MLRSSGGESLRKSRQLPTLQTGHSLTASYHSRERPDNLELRAASRKGNEADKTTDYLGAAVIRRRWRWPLQRALKSLQGFRR
jgi:hypothetical protein